MADDGAVNTAKHIRADRGTANGTLICPDGTQNGTPICQNGTRRDTNGHQRTPKWCPTSLWSKTKPVEEYLQSFGR